MAGIQRRASTGWNREIRVLAAKKIMESFVEERGGKYSMQADTYGSGTLRSVSPFTASFFYSSSSKILPAQLLDHNSDFSVHVRKFARPLVVPKNNIALAKEFAEHYEKEGKIAPVIRRRALGEFIKDKFGDFMDKGKTILALESKRKSRQENKQRRRLGE